MATADEVLAFLDECAQGYSFPMLDNGYEYLAATRLSLHRSPSQWAMVIEVFGYSVRAGDPDLTVHTFTGSDHEYDSFHPIGPDDWTDADDVKPGTTQVVLRGEPVELPAVEDYAAHGIDLEDPEPAVIEVCRYLAAVHRDRVLATTEERRTRLRPDLRELLVLDEWHHPDLGEGQRPSDIESFWQLAMVLETGDVTLYRPPEPPNTHWRHWPEGGTL